MAGEKPKKQPEMAKLSGLNFFSHNHTYFVMGILEMQGLFSIALIQKTNNPPPGHKGVGYWRIALKGTIENVGL